MKEFEACQECGAPMDRGQRYCVVCAARRADVSNPASRYFAAASRQRRQNATKAATPPPTSNGVRTAGVFFFALLPIAVAVGVLVGRSGSSSDNDQLLAALREADAGALAASSSDAKADDAASPTELLTSDFSLDSGFTVQLDLLPIDSTDQAAVDAAESDAEGKGAEDVGIINPGDYRSTPDQGQQNYILYSGEFKDRAAAEKALAGLKKDFPDATVIQVESSAAAATVSTKGGGTDVNPNKVVAETSHGTVHQVSTAPPSKEQVEHDTAIVNQIGNETGEDYTDLQQSLPDVTVVGGDPGDAPPLPTGAGD